MPTINIKESSHSISRLTDSTNYSKLSLWKNDCIEANAFTAGITVCFISQIILIYVDTYSRSITIQK